MRQVHDLGDVDLNLLPLLDSLLTTTSVSESARQLGRTQSGLSHALARLRELFDDPLLVRTGNQMTLTPVAESLRLPAKNAVAQLVAVISRRSFSPAESQLQFHISASGYASAVIVPRLITHLAEHSPGLRLHVYRTGDHVDRLVRDGDMDLALGSRYRPLSGILRRVLRKDPFVVAMRNKHPMVTTGKALSLSMYCKAAHVLVSPRGTPGSTVDAALSGLGRERKLSLVTDSFSLALRTVAQSDLITTLPRSLVATLAPSLGLALVGPPLRLRLDPVELTMTYGEVKRDDPAHHWLREQILELHKR